MKYYAILIGNGIFPNEPDPSKLPPLPAATHDIAGLHAALTDSQHGLFQAENIVQIQDETREVILEKVEDLLSEAKTDKNNLVLLYYSGHGWLDKDNRLYLTTRNTQVNRLNINGIPFDTLYQSIQATHCDKQVIILDCCYSGAAIEGLVKGDNDIALKAELEKINADAQGTYLLTASAHLQVAGASSDGSNCSLFTHHLIDGLKGKAQADDKEQISLDNLFDYAESAVKSVSGQKTPDGKFRRAQTPLLSAPRKKGTLYLAKSGRDSRKKRADDIKPYLYDLAKDERISHDILTESLGILAKPLKELTQAEAAKDALLTQVLSNHDAVAFVRQWDRLDYAAQANAKQIEIAQQAEAQRVAEAAKHADAVKQTAREADEAKQVAAQREQKKQAAVAKQLAETQRLTAELAQQTQLAKQQAAAQQAELARQQAELAQRRRDLEQQTAREVATPLPFTPPIPRTSWSPQLGIGVAVIASVAFAGWIALAKDKPAETPVAPASANKFGITMVKVDAGSFTMGCQSGRDTWANEKGEQVCDTAAQPSHSVTIPAFELGKTEVTQGQWKAVMGSNPSNFKDCGDTCPVENVSWDDVQVFIQKLNAQTGKTYRLPSEAEWEYACRAGQSTNYCGGNDVNVVAWYGAYSTPVGNSGKTTNPVKTKQPNAWGLYDMSGNVWEWVQDSYHSDYKGAPSNGDAWEGTRADARVLRGGSWSGYPQVVRAANRSWGGASSRGSGVGFRLARTLP